MSTGEVLFILAFIVLPTAILVSSVWAVIFVRRRPDRIYREPDAAAEPAMTAQDPSLVETALFPSYPVSAEPDEEELPVTEHDVIVITDESLDGVAIGDEVAQPAAGDQEPIEEEVTIAQIEPADVESPVLQSTEDLDEVVNSVRDLDQAEVSEEPVDQPEEQPMAEVDEEPEEESFTETSELPTVEKASEPQPQVEIAQPEPEEPEPTESATSSRWRRRKQSVKLRPGDPEAPRARGRNRDPQRQVPQIVRPSRRRDDAGQTPPPEPDTKQDSTSTPD